MRDVLWHGQDVVAALQSHLTTSARDDWRAQGVAIDTRDLLAGDIFVALPGEKAHGHDYVKQAFEAGAAAALVGADFDTSALNKQAVVLLVDDVLAAMPVRLPPWSIWSGHIAPSSPPLQRRILRILNRWKHWPMPRQKS